MTNLKCISIICLISLSFLAIELRYSYLPYIYTLFHENELNGSPPNRPLWFEFPQDTKSFEIDQTFLLGNALLVAPVAKKRVTSLSVYFPGDENTSWIRKGTLLVYGGGSKHTIDAPINSLPHFQRSGTIIAKRERMRRSALLAINDPLTLDIFIDKNGNARGRVYLDDGQSFNYRKGEFLFGDLSLEKKTLKYVMNESGKYNSKSWLERVNIYGWNGGKTSKVVSQVGGKSSQLLFISDDAKRVLTIRKPALFFTQNWQIKIS
jgi:mannosyl-oligosaccharide alpha-1,3-glucosidase